MIIIHLPAYSCDGLAIYALHHSVRRICWLPIGTLFAFVFFSKIYPLRPAEDWGKTW